MTAERRPTKVDRTALAQFLIHAQMLQLRRFAPWGMTPGAWDMVMTLYLRTPRRAVTSKALCLSSGVPTRTAIRIIDRLVARGLLGRRTDPSDRRQINLELSRLAIRLLDAHFDELAALAEQGLTQAESRRHDHATNDDGRSSSDRS